MSGLNLIALFAIAGGGFILLHFFCWYVESRVWSKEWNNGYCPKCELGKWVHFDADGQGAVGYICTNCRKFIFK